MLRDIVAVQRREFDQRMSERYVHRHLHVPVRDDDLIKVIIGPRRSGKSCLAIHLVAAQKSHAYLNFDDERLVNLQDYDEIIAAMNAVYEEPKSLLLDEIQNLPRWELFVNRLQRQGYRLFLTGSNAHLLSSELATHLTGRHVPVFLFPFSFGEYVSALDRETTGPEMKETFLSYVEQGGMPEPIVRNMDRTSYLRTLWDSILYKDIVKRHSIRSVAGIEDLASYLLANVASEFSFGRLTEVTKCRSVHTVQKYIGHLCEAFLFFSLSRFSVRVREQARANRKIYCIDNGFITARGFQFTDVMGALFENLVAITLRKRQLEGLCEVYFWKSAQQEEVDFVVKKRTKVTQLIQACWDLQTVRTRDREIRALIKASEALHCDDLLILTAATEGEETVTWYGIQRRIRLIPFPKWEAV